MGHSGLNGSNYQRKFEAPERSNEWNLEHLSPSLVIFPLCPTLDHERYYKSDSYIVWGLEFLWDRVYYQIILDATGKHVRDLVMGMW